MSADLRNARRALRTAITHLFQSAESDTLDAYTRARVRVQAQMLAADVDAVTECLAEEAAHREQIRRAKLDRKRKA